MSATDRKHKFEGEKFRATEQLTDVQVAALIRKDLKAAFPGFKFRVRTDCPAINVLIVAVPEGFTIYNPDWEPELAFHGPANGPKQYTAEAAQVHAEATTIFDAYNYDDSDCQTDYFNTRYYGRVSWGISWKAKEVR